MKYEQSTGRLCEDDGSLVGLGWAGHLDGKNNPAMQDVKGVGPLPKGTYTIEDPEDGTHLGPLAFPLTPNPTNVMFGRSGFFLHAAEIKNPSMSSDGCIIMNRMVREFVAQKIEGTTKDSPERLLVVF